MVVLVSGAIPPGNAVDYYLVHQAEVGQWAIEKARTAAGRPGVNGGRRDESTIQMNLLQASTDSLGKGKWALIGTAVTGLVWLILNAKKLREGGLTIWEAITKLLRLNPKQVDQSGTAPLTVGGEKVTYTELVRSMEWDAVIVHSYTHGLGVAAEHHWIRQNYPGCRTLRQYLTDVPKEGEDGSSMELVPFDVVEFETSEGHLKKVFFDISSFFDVEGPSDTEPDRFIRKTLARVYRKRAEDEARRANTTSQRASPYGGKEEA